MVSSNSSSASGEKVPATEDGSIMVEPTICLTEIPSILISGRISLQLICLHIPPLILRLVLL